MATRNEKRAFRQTKKQYSRRVSDNVPDAYRRQVRSNAISRGVGLSLLATPAVGIPAAIIGRRRDTWAVNSTYDRANVQRTFNQNLQRLNARNRARGGRAASNAAQV